MLNRYSITYRLYNEKLLVQSPATDWLLVLTWSSLRCIRRDVTRTKSSDQVRFDCSLHYLALDEMLLGRSRLIKCWLLASTLHYIALDEMLLGRSRLIKCWLLVLRPFYNLRTKAPTNERWAGRRRGPMSVQTKQTKVNEMKTKWKWRHRRRKREYYIGSYSSLYINSKI